MENRGLLFIPDISGFSRFVNAVELEHSRFIIQQLLDVLLRANDSGLQISEIEGDAILFYQFGEPVDLRALYQQVEKMFRAFHQYLVAYDHLKICQCKACLSAVDLTLKVITHYGEFTPLRVQHFEKLIGKDVIVAHQLLKNDIPQHEYWLVTHDLHRQPAELTQWMQWQESAKETESGEIRFYYTQLGPMKPPRSKLRGITRKDIVCETPRFLTLFPLQGNLEASSEESPDLCSRKYLSPKPH